MAEPFLPKMNSKEKLREIFRGRATSNRMMRMGTNEVINIVATRKMINTKERQEEEIEKKIEQKGSIITSQ